MQKGREPLDFKLVQKKRSTGRLIERLRFSDFSSSEPNPFRILDHMKEEYGDLFHRHPDRRTNGQVDETGNASDGDEDEDEDEDEEDDDEEEENGKRGSGLLDYLTACAIM